MQKYTIGAVLAQDLNKIILILKTRPDWQAGLYNLLGGHVELKERSATCIAREFKEECGLTTFAKDWEHVGAILNRDNYLVNIHSIIYNPSIHGEILSLTDETVIWADCNNLPPNIISNLKWIIPFCQDYYKSNSIDKIYFGGFEYKYPSHS